MLGSATTTARRATPEQTPLLAGQTTRTRGGHGRVPGEKQHYAVLRHSHHAILCTHTHTHIPWCALRSSTVRNCVRSSSSHQLLHDEHYNKWTTRTEQQFQLIFPYSTTCRNTPFSIGCCIPGTLVRDFQTTKKYVTNAAMISDFPTLSVEEELGPGGTKQTNIHSPKVQLRLLTLSPFECTYAHSTRAPTDFPPVYEQAKNYNNRALLSTPSSAMFSRFPIPILFSRGKNSTLVVQYIFSRLVSTRAPPKKYQLERPQR